jgi:hypothetical protein
MALLLVPLRSSGNHRRGWRDLSAGNGKVVSLITAESGITFDFSMEKIVHSEITSHSRFLLRLAIEPL